MIYGGLKELPPDPNDYSLGAIFNSIPLADLPKHFVLPPTAIRDQGNTMRCTAYAIASSLERHEQTPISPDFQWENTEVEEKDTYGVDLRTACKVPVNVGVLPENLVDSMDRELEIELHRQGSFFRVDGRYDVFDNIRTALFTHKDSSVVTGIKWRHNWTYTDGIIEESSDDGFGHCIELIGWDTIGTETRIITQLTNGTDIGKSGLFYLPRGIINRELNYGIYMFKDLAKDYAKYLGKNKLRLSDPLLKKLWVGLKQWLTR